MLIAVVAVIVVGAVGFFLISGNKTSVPSVSETQTSTTPTEAMEASPSASDAMMTEEQTVSLTADGFSPATLTIEAGAKVTWINKSGGAATVNSGPHPTHTNYSPLNLGTFRDGETLSLAFDKAGTYGYHNHLNPSQKGTIVVE